MENLNEKLEAKKKAFAAKEAEVKKQKEEAMAYVENFKKDHKYISIRIRDGFIGKELSEDGRILQPYRTRPRGTMVAFKNPNNENELRIGISYLHGYIDKDVPIIGIANAIKYANSELNNYMATTLKEDENGIKVCYIMNTDSYNSINKNDKDLLNFFKIRALCYFYPEIYSHSRGYDKIEYPNYEKNHKNRLRVLGE